MKQFAKTDVDLVRVEKTKQEILQNILSGKINIKTIDPNLEIDSPQEDISKSLDHIINNELKSEIFINDKYQVLKKEIDTDWGEMVELSIRRLDREVIKDWRDFQEIKNQLIGEENEGIELYPSESRLVDSANQYYMFVFKDPNIRLPFGFQRRYVNYDNFSTTKQRCK